MALRQIEEMAKLRDAIFNDIKKMEESGKNNDFYDFRRYPRIISFEEFCDIMGKEYSEDKMSEITGIPKELLYGPKQNKTENEESAQHGSMYRSGDEWNKETFKQPKDRITPEELKSAMEEFKQLNFAEIFNNFIEEEVRNTAFTESSDGEDSNECGCCSNGCTDCECDEDCCCNYVNNDKHTSDNHIGTTLPSIIEESLLAYKKNIEAKRKAEIDDATEETKKFTKWLEELSVKDGEYDPSVILEHSLEYFKQKKISAGTYYTQKLREIDSALHKYNFE